MLDPVLRSGATRSTVAKRLFATLALLIAYRFGFTVPIPGMSPEFLNSQKDQGSLFGLMSAFSGGAIGQTSIIALGLLPYLASSLFFWLLLRTSPSVRALHDRNAAERRRFRQWKRLGVLPLAFLFALFVYVGIFLRNTEMIDERMRGSLLLLGFIVTLSLVTGAMLVMWIAEMITNFGIGHGTLLIVAAGVLARIPHAMLQLQPEQFWSRTIQWILGIWITFTLVILFAARDSRGHR